MRIISIMPIMYGDEWWQAVTQCAANCSWRAGASLARLMQEGAFSDWERVFAAIDCANNVAGFCTLSKTDCIQDVDYSPYISFVFVGEPYRGKRLSERLIARALSYAKEIGFDEAYLVSDHIGLYEKYGFVKIDEKEAPWGAMETIYKHLT